MYTKHYSKKSEACYSYKWVVIIYLGENSMKQLMILIFLSLVLVNGQAEVYRWVDNEGNIQLTETPPPPGAQAEGTVVEEMETPISEESESITEEKVPEEEKANATEEGETPAEGETAPAPAEKVLAAKRKNCETAQGRMQALNSGKAILKKDETGKGVLMSDDVRQAAIAETQEYIKMYCGNDDEADNSETETNSEAE